MSKVGSRLIRSAKQALAYARGEAVEGFVIHLPEDVDVRSIRRRLGYSQSEFSKRFGFAIDALQDREQRRRRSDHTARIFWTVIAREPDAVSRTLSS